ncbi:MAG: IclR family transcriptional regulator C-terminal domain-containing protein [Actinomycetes bacterium]
MSATEMSVRSADFVQSLDRGLAVIRAFSRERPRLTLSDVARETGMTRAAARRFLLTLEELGYVGSDGRLFYLRPRVLELGFAYLSSATVTEVTQGHLEVLADGLHESCSASVLDSPDIVYVARAATNRIMTISLAVGARLPAYCTSMGRVLLAALDDTALEEYLSTGAFVALSERTLVEPDAIRAEIEVVRARGWALQDQELEAGVRSVAVPVHAADGQVIAAINVSAHASRVSLDTLLEDFLPRLTSTAQLIDQDLAHGSIH